MCTKNCNHMRYGSWNREWNRQKNIISVVFFKKNQEKHLEKSLVYTCIPKILICSTILWDRVWHTEIGNYGSFFAFLPPPWKPKKSEFWKNEKICWRHHFTHWYLKPQYEVRFLRYVVKQTEKSCTTIDPKN